ncbi:MULTISPECIES: hypothetical protein [unclassified Peribacillus]|nr:MULTISPECIES: hypothetical protein [unclassified Peribacillus]MBK5502985.1 hypothetical protein [Peribacillus sp. TH14]WMX58888.1 hypothetical protein RE409_30230 [Peribacillus sp. R9-11]
MELKERQIKAFVVLPIVYLLLSNSLIPHLFAAEEVSADGTIFSYPHR